MYRLAELFAAVRSPAEYADGYIGRLAELLSQIDEGAVGRMLDMLERAGAEGRTIFLAANGGSAAVAAHFVNDLVVLNCGAGSAPPYRAMALSDNVESVMAIANDYGYAEVFSRQLRAWARPGDVLIAISVSGNSENILRAAETMKALGGRAIGWQGFEGGRLAGLCDLAIVAPGARDEYGPVEDAFGVLSHIASGYLTMKRGGQLHH